MKTAILLFLMTVSVAASENVKAVATKEPSLQHMLELEKIEGRTFFLERYSSDGRLLSRKHEPYISGFFVTPSMRKINGKLYVLRGLDDCPWKKISDPKGNIHECEPWAKEFVDSQYSEFARLILCRTFDTDPNPSNPIAVSCFILIGRGNESLVTYDDDAMVFTRVVSIRRDAAGKSLRPDLSETETMALGMFGEAN